MQRILLILFFLLPSCGEAHKHADSLFVAAIREAGVTQKVLEKYLIRNDVDTLYAAGEKIKTIAKGLPDLIRKELSPRSRKSAKKQASKLLTYSIAFLKALDEGNRNRAEDLNGKIRNQIGMLGKHNAQAHTPHS